jgi:hypothetical protein
VIALEAERPGRRHAVEAMCAVLGGAYVVTLLVPGLRDFFALAVPSASMIAAAIAGAAISIAALRLSGFSERAPHQPARS